MADTNILKKICDIRFICQNDSLNSLDLHSKRINDIKFLKNRTELQSLDLSSNHIYDTRSLQNLTGLQSLNLSHNLISDISFLQNLTQLQFLDLSDNPISNYSFLQNLNRLKSLNLSYNQISDYSFLQNLTELKSLHLRYNKISNISFLHNLDQLRYLDLHNNRISDISSLRNLTRLQYLDLHHNIITDISSLQNLTRLQSLNLRYNMISDISFLENLTELQLLNLHYNQISDIRSLQDLTRLQSLHLSYNQISDLKPILSLIKKGLKLSTSNGGSIHIQNNKITSPPLTIINKGNESIISWFEQMEKGKKPLFESRLMILGQGGAGKSTLAKLLFDPQYTVKPGKLDFTLGIEVHKNRPFPHAHLKGQDISAHLWDFGGQDIQKMLHQYFITEECLYILVSDKRSENTNFDYWFQIVQSLGPQSTVIVLENPKDISGALEDFPLHKYRDMFKDLTIESVEVNLKETRRYHKSYWTFFLELISEKLSKLDIVNRDVPRSWSLVRDGLVKRKDDKYIRKDAFYAICAQPEIGMTKEEGDLCLYYLKSLGDLVYFDDRSLSTHIFLDHNWLTKGMYYILSDKQISDNGGRFTREQAYRSWSRNGYNEEEKAMLLRLLLKDNFDLCYELKDQKDVFITPILLPNDKPVTWNCETNLYFRYQYGFMPHGLFARLMVQLHEFIDGDNRWKTGMRLLTDACGKPVHAEVQLLNDPEDNQQVIDIKIHGNKEGSRKLLYEIRRAVEKLHKSFHISCKELVACNCATCTQAMKKGEKPSFLSFDKLMKKIQNRKYFEECAKSNYEPVNIGRILSDIIIEHAGNDNLDREFFYKLKEMGLSMNQIINNQNMTNCGNANANASAQADAKATATADVSIHIQTLLSETEMLKEDIERELKITQKMPEDEIRLVTSDIALAEEAIKDLELCQQENREPNPKSKSRLRRFIEDLSDEESLLRKSLKLIRKGKDYGVEIAKAYNKMAENTGLPSVPPFILESVEKV